MGLKDVFKGDSKWKLGLGESTHGGNAWEGRGRDAKEAAARSVANENKRKVQAAEAKIKSCRKCKRISKKDQRNGVTCGGHAKELKIIAKYS